ncbi:hypothetical protein KC850_03685 [Candidatus Kaiserbacteria bacterium]|nr:hypothetical protein [Candidatus Kaiserbacteria bacterium]
MKNVTGVVTVQNKKYTYTLTKKAKETINVECEAAKINQEFLSEDVADLLIDLPNLILAEKNYQKKQSDVIRFRISPEDKIRIEKKAIRNGFSSVSDYMRDLALS